MNFIAKKLFLIGFLSFAFINLNAQKGNSKLANELFNANNFIDALDEFELLVAEEPQNTKYLYQLAVCYLNTNVDKTKAVSLLETVLEKEKSDPNTTYLLGRAYHFAGRYDKAIKKYEEFKQNAKGSSFNLADVDKQIEHCYNAKELIKFPVDVTFENLGPDINSTAPEYFPFVTSNEEFIVYNTKKDDGSKPMSTGHYYSQVYFSKVTPDGLYSKGKSLSDKINTLDGNEEIIGMSSDGKFMLFYYDNEEGYGDIYIAEFDGKNVNRLKKLDKTINSKHIEIAAAISTDGKTIYFASNRPGGYGGVDLYVSRQLPNGKWGPAENLGSEINTKYDEDFPNISADGKVLYFSSKGHTSMGGFDIFKAELDENSKSWTKVKNLGYPVNTPEDDMNFRASANGRYGYISALRKEGKGNLDIYRVIFNEVEPEYTVVKGFVTSKDTANKITDVFISVTDLNTNDIYGEYLTNPKTGRYIMILPPGKYNLLVDATGYKMYSEDIEILGKSSYQTEIKKDILVNE